MQATSQQLPISEAPGGEILPSKASGLVEGKETTRVAMGLAQGLQPQTLSKNQQKKQQRRLAKQQQESSTTQAPPSQHYKEKVPPKTESTTPTAEGISKESSFEQRTQHLSETEKEKQRLADKESSKESPILSTTQKPKILTTTTSFEPPLLSASEQSRQLQARKEVGRLEEIERQDRIARAKREDMQALAAREASLMGTVREEEEERKRRIEENAKLDAREAESEASLMGTVIDEERERQRRIEEDYPTFTEPLEKTKALEEIERRRRLYSQAEKNRQKLAATASAKLFPNAKRSYLDEQKLWAAGGLLKRDTPLPSLFEEKPRFGQFIATTTKTTSSHLGVAELQTKQVRQAHPSKVSEILVAGHGPQMKLVETTYSAGMDKPSVTKVCKDTYRSQTRPRLVVHHSGLSGKWQRQRETVELEEGVDY